MADQTKSSVRKGESRIGDGSNEQTCQKPKPTGKSTHNSGLESPPPTRRSSKPPGAPMHSRWKAKHEHFVFGEGSQDKTSLK
uniref:Uncharacterized protein n=1 Tax=viral metagenome TaxID=1070528 RepID=A0A6C0H7X5_9ZZZZ